MALSTGSSKYIAKALRVTLLPIILFLTAVATGCKDTVLNNPYPNEPEIANTYYSSFAERPKHLDPARSYSAGEWTFIGQIYEPPLEYHYLHRPYELVPLSAAKMPVAKQDGDFTSYEITIKPGIYYQPHPAFARDELGKYYYHALTVEAINNCSNLGDFAHTATRELTAADFVYQLKRLADPKLAAPIYGFISNYIYGMSELHTELQKAYSKDPEQRMLDLRQYHHAGVEQTGKYTYKIKIKGNYQQFKYWLAMPFFAPVPWEAISFYRQAGMEERNITMDWYPIGTGPYMLIENNPDRRMVMVRNPNFHGQVYPSTGDVDDKENGLLDDAGKYLPFVDKIIFSLEKESIPYWSKFLQGYYDASGISADNFNNAIDITAEGIFDVTPELREKGIKLQTSVSPSVMYWAFNMLDSVVGGYNEQAVKLRQAISIAFDVEEFTSIFLNGRGISAHSPIPPGIIGHDSGINSIVYIDDKQTQLQRRGIAEAKTLLASAGYPGGRSQATGEQLVINFEAISTGDPDEKAMYEWLRKQLAKLDLELVIRATDYNRFREKMSNGDAQMFFWGWNADYPDPENFLFMLYGPNGKVKHAGENAANYHSARFDQMFEELRRVTPGAEQQELIKKMVTLLQHDAPWIWGYHPQAYTLAHAWNRVLKPNNMANNALKYIKIDPVLRNKQRIAWNKPIWWPLLLVALGGIVLVLPVWRQLSRHERKQAARVN